MKIEVSAGECFDKVSILEIKSERLQEEKKQHAIKERDHLKESVGEHAHIFEHSVYEDLCEVNNTLWVIEDEIREKEKLQEFDDEFIQLARKVYITNDRRFNLKNKINEMTNSEFKEQKSHDDCD